MRLSGKSFDANSELLMDTIRCLDYESIVVEKPSVNYIITVIGLMWEHVDHTKFDLRKFIIKILSRIGYPTSAIICDKDFDCQRQSKIVRKRRRNYVVFRRSNVTVLSVAFLKQSVDDLMLLAHKLLTFFQPV